MKDNRICKNCFWGDKCPNDKICDCFYPLVATTQNGLCVEEWFKDIFFRLEFEEDNTQEGVVYDEWIDEYIENKRIEYRKEWFDRMDCGDDEFIEDIYE